MQPTSGVLTSLLVQFNSVFKAAGAGIVSDAVGLAGLLVGLELVIAGLYWAASGNEFIPQLVWKIVRIGIFTWIVKQWPSLTDTVLSGFIHTGAHAGATAAFKDPSSILDMAAKVLDPINNQIMLLSKGAGVLTNFGSILLFDAAWDLAFIAFAILGIQAFITSLEFGILSTLAVILVPFGIFRPLAFLAEKAFGMVVGFGVRMMVLAFIFGAAFPILSTAALPAEPTINQAMFIVTGAFAIVFLAWHAPSIAASMMSGGPSLSAGTVGAAGMAAGLAAVGTVQAARMVAEGGAAMANQIFNAANGGGSSGTASTIAAANPTGSAGGAGGAPGAGNRPTDAALRQRMEQSFNASGGQSAGGSNAGAAGAEGAAGTTGTAGSAGASGSTGAAGGSGVSGSAGSAGADGGSGSAGSAGSGGSEGAAAAAGAAGEGGAAEAASGSQSSPSSFAGETATTRDSGNGWNSRPPSDTPQRPNRQSSNAGSTFQKAIETGMREESPSQGANPSLNGGEA